MQVAAKRPITDQKFANIRAIVFDAVGTLIHPSPAPGIAYLEVGRRHGSSLTKDEVCHRFASAFQAQEERDRLVGYSTDEEREVERWRQIVGSVLDDVRDTESTFAELFAYFAQASAWSLDPDAPSLLGHCSRQGYRLAIASNYDYRLHEVVAGFPELVIIDPVLASSELGWRKPARGFFDAVAGRLGMEHRAILYVGDQLANDYQAALDAGLCALCIDPVGQHAGRRPDRISTLAELINQLPPAASTSES
jgi:putative hydrolase of the HAD superfamily